MRNRLESNTFGRRKGLHFFRRAPLRPFRSFFSGSLWGAGGGHAGISHTSGGCCPAGLGLVGTGDYAGIGALHDLHADAFRQDGGRALAAAYDGLAVRIPRRGPSAGGHGAGQTRCSPLCRPQRYHEPHVLSGHDQPLDGGSKGRGNHFKAFYETVAYAQSKGMYVIADAKRNDIGSTAGAYSKAFFDTLGSEALTVNGYLGYDGVEPFVRDGKMIFVLVKTSNPGSGQLQDLKLENGKTIYEQMGGYVEEWGAPSIGEYGYSNVGAVVGATHKAQLQELREKLPHTFFLIPGYGAQGGTAEDIAVGFVNGTGAIVNSSRGIMCAYKKQNLPAEKFAEAARNEAIRMRDEINSKIL